MNVCAVQPLNSSLPACKQPHLNTNEKKNLFVKPLSNPFSWSLVSDVALAALLVFAGASAFLSPPVISFTAVVIAALSAAFIVHQFWERFYSKVNKFYAQEALITEVIDRDLKAVAVSADHKQPSVLKVDKICQPGLFLRQSSMWKRTSPWAVEADESDDDEESISCRPPSDRAKVVPIALASNGRPDLSPICFNSPLQLLSKQEELFEVQRLLKINYKNVEDKIERKKERFVYLKKKLSLGSWALDTASLAGKIVDKSRLLFLLVGHKLTNFSEVAGAISFSKDIFGIFEKILRLGKIKLSSIETSDLQKKLEWMESQKKELHTRIIEQPHTVEEHYRAHLRYCALEQNIDDIRLQIGQKRAKNVKEMRKLWAEAVQLTAEGIKDTLAFVRSFKRFQATHSIGIKIFCRSVDSFNLAVACGDLAIHCYKLIGDIKNVRSCSSLIGQSQKLREYGEAGSLGDAHVHYILHLKKAYLIKSFHKRIVKIIERCLKIGVSIGAIAVAAKVILFLLGVSMGVTALSVVGALSSAFVLMALVLSCFHLCNQVFSKRHEMKLAIVFLANYRQIYRLSEKRNHMMARLYQREKEGVEKEFLQEELCKLQQINLLCKDLHEKLHKAEGHCEQRKIEDRFYKGDGKTARICRNVLFEALNDDQTYSELVNNLRSLGIIVVGRLTITELLKKIASSDWDAKKLLDDLVRLGSLF